MSQTKQPADQPNVTTRHTENYRDSYANSVQVRMSVWDFFLVFGTMHQESPEEVNIENFQGIYLSPQQAKALMNVLNHNLAQYEQTFGALALEPQFGPPGGPVH
jgi:flagellar protein FlaG